MKTIECLVIMAVLSTLASCTGLTPTGRTEMKQNLMDSNTSERTVLFEDTMMENWQKNWFLDGKNAVVEHRDGGLAFVTDYKFDKRVDRAGFDAQHAVLWTKQEFEGDIRISYTFTKLPDCSWQKLIYVHAQGIGTEEYPEDIYAWRGRRDVASMSKYFNYMNLIGLSLRDEIRCKRYPWNDVKRDVQLKSEFLPRAENKGLSISHQLHCVVEKRKESISLKIKDLETDTYVVDHSWDLTQNLEDKDPKYVDKGRIGIRQMGGHKIIFRDFKVESL